MGGDQLSLNYGSDTLESFYQRLDKLGEGTFGTVYKAQDLQTKEFVALKRILRQSIDVAMHGRWRQVIDPDSHRSPRGAKPGSAD